MTKTMRERLIMAADPHIGDIEQTTGDGRQWMIGQAVDAILAELRTPDERMIRASSLAAYRLKHDQSAPLDTNAEEVTFTAMIDHVREGK